MAESIHAKDDFESPKRHNAPKKSVVNSVLTRVVSAGNSLLSLLTGLLAAVLILYSGYVLYDTFYIQNNAASSSFELLQHKPEIIEEGTVPLAGEGKVDAIAENYRAWLTMYGSNIDYPVMQGTDDLYYASHDIYDQISLTGAIYVAAANNSTFSDSYNLVYGHHMDNGAMFGGLDAYKNQSYFNANREGLLVTNSGVFDLRTFAVLTTDAYENEIYTVGDRMDDVLAFLRAHRTAPDAKSETLILDESALNGATKIVALSTCASANTNGRLVVFATMTRRNMMTLDATGYEGEYDALAHGVQEIVANYTEGTVYSYSIDGGRTWSDVMPELTNVGELTVMIRAENEYYGSDTATVTLVVNPRPITIKAADEFKVFGEDDPAWTVEQITGIVDGFEPVYTLRRNGADEEVGTYEGVLVAEGEALQGNYIITYLPGDFTITAANTLALIADGYAGVYDMLAHSLLRTEVNITEGTLVEYSVDGGLTWTTEAPQILDVGSMLVMVRATNANYETVYENVVLRVTPATVYVTAARAEKVQGANDPRFTATVEGVLDGFEIQFTVSRPGAGSDEDAGVYREAIVPEGAEYQGNYRVVYVPADFTVIRNTSVVIPDDSVIDNPMLPLAGWMEQFLPGPRRSTPAWALINLISLIVTVYILLPLFHIKGKYSRARTIKKINEESGEERYNVRKFRRKFTVGIILEAVFSVLALLLFILTENMRLPMVLIDKWTPLMLIILAATWVFDITLTGVKEEKQEDESAVKA